MERRASLDIWGQLTLSILAWTIALLLFGTMLEVSKRECEVYVRANGLPITIVGRVCGD